MPQVNWLAVLAAGLFSSVLGGLWYSVLFARPWQDLVGMTDEKMRSGNKALTFGGAFALSLIASAVFAMFLGPKVTLGFGAAAGFAAGLCWVGASFGINDLFEQRPLKLTLINAGYHTLQFTAMGAILGAWR